MKESTIQFIREMLKEEVHRLECEVLARVRHSGKDANKDVLDTYMIAYRAMEDFDEES